MTGILLVLLASVLWGASGPLAHILKATRTDILDVFSWRYPIGLVGLPAFVFACRRDRAVALQGRALNVAGPGRFFGGKVYPSLRGGLLTASCSCPLPSSELCGTSTGKRTECPRGVEFRMADDRGGAWKRLTADPCLRVGVCRSGQVPDQTAGPSAFGYVAGSCSC
jgi:hypothetical protein